MIAKKLQLTYYRNFILFQKRKKNIILIKLYKKIRKRKFQAYLLHNMYRQTVNKIILRLFGEEMLLRK